MPLKMTRVWAMPNADTFSMEPIGELVKRYLRESKVSVDPFARNKRWATYTNDLNPDTEAEYHLDVLDFLLILKGNGIIADLIIFDPPYSLHQLKTTYEGAGGRMTADDTGRVNRWTKERNVVNDILKIGGIVISCGWNSSGMGEGRAYEKLELLVTCCGAGHNDILTLVERKLVHQPRLFE